MRSFFFRKCSDSWYVMQHGLSLGGKLFGYGHAIIYNMITKIKQRSHFIIISLCLLQFTDIDQCSGSGSTRLPNHTCFEGCGREASNSLAELLMYLVGSKKAINAKFIIVVSLKLDLLKITITTLLLRPWEKLSNVMSHINVDKTWVIF